jgi:hypothetical protein
MSNEAAKIDAISIDIDDLTEVVGGIGLNVTPLNESVLSGSPTGGIVGYNPETCPGTEPYPGPGGPSTCMCPGRVIGGR